MNRKQFIGRSIFGVAALSYTPQVFAQQEKPVPLKADLILNFVRNGHFDLEVVKQMLEEVPSLLNASWDWGGGDFETALGGAAHMGRYDIATFLISKGARMDIFAAAMLGEISIVKAILKAHPPALQSKGPHGISLFAHAEKGGKKGKEVVNYLNTLGIKE